MTQTGSTQSASRKRLLVLLGVLAVVGVTYLSLPRSWFEVPEEGTPAARPAVPAQNVASVAPDLAAMRAEVERSPRDFEARSRYGMALAAAGRPAEAEKEFLAAIRLAPESPVVYHNLGVLYHNQGQAARADAAFRRELELAPGSGLAHHYRGLALQEMRQYRQAIQQFRLAIALEPDLAPPYLSLALLLSREGAEEEVRRLVEEYIRRAGDRGLAYFVLSGAYSTRGDYARAARYAELALEAEPNKYAYLHHLGKVYSYARVYDRAEEYLKRALEMAKDKTTIWIELGMNAQNAQRFPDAAAYFQQALRANPRKGEIHLYLARVYQRMGDREAARREEVTFRRWQRAVLEADARAKRQQRQPGVAPAPAH
ncbi:MAG: tetratricopeptide repeat protein [Chloroherpetonaceae bacterium]|nr:tetratricopeptide repeat protein [Chthonomonadaceae bacterium]MDW8206276.1 tetratricopeptide repeat protein [Chloroherpetonaceae bacterium]